MSIILGIDPGSRITGFGVVRQQGQKFSYIGSGCIRTKADDLPTRLHQIFAGISEVIIQYKPEQVAVEQVFMSTNAQSALKLGQARGSAIVAAVQAGLPVAEYSARQIKQAVVGTGAAKKNQVQHMVSSILKLKGTPQEDAADGLAVAICHGHSNQTLLAMAGSAKRVVRGRMR